MGNELFAILLDESHDVSIKKQMAIALHYIDKRGCIIERSPRIIHVSATIALTLKCIIEILFSKHELSISQICSQS